jgi:hypothetical protein
LVTVINKTSEKLMAFLIFPFDKKAIMIKTPAKCLWYKKSKRWKENKNKNTGKTYK